MAMATTEERALRSYVDAFNRHGIGSVMACFDEKPVVVDMLGQRHARCDIKAVAGHASTGMAETEFHGTHAKTGKVVIACGPEVVGFTGDRIRTLRDYHRLTPP
jgi:hypothetical protein